MLNNAMNVLDLQGEHFEADSGEEAEQFAVHRAGSKGELEGCGGEIVPAARWVRLRRRRRLQQRAAEGRHVALQVESRRRLIRLRCVAVGLATSHAVTQPGQREDEHIHKFEVLEI